MGDGRLDIHIAPSSNLYISLPSGKISVFTAIASSLQVSEGDNLRILMTLPGKNCRYDPTQNFRDKGEPTRRRKPGRATTSD